MPLTSFKDVQDFVDSVLTQNGELGGAAFAPHRAFWKTMSYEAFVTGNVPGVSDPDTGAPMPVLVKGNSAQSILILALRGEGSLFNPETGAFGQMPANGPPMFTADQIQQIAEWIDAGCPE